MRMTRASSEINHHATIAGRTQSGGERVMVWEKFSWHYLTPLVPLEGILEPHGYLYTVYRHGSGRPIDGDCVPGVRRDLSVR